MGQFQHKVHANLEFSTSCGLTKNETVSHRTSILRTVRKSIIFSNFLHRLYKTNVPLNIIFKPHSSASFWYVCLGMVGSSSTQNIYKHDVFAVLRPHARVYITIAGTAAPEARGKPRETKQIRGVSGECQASVRRVQCWSVVARKRQSLGTASCKLMILHASGPEVRRIISRQCANRFEHLQRVSVGFKQRC